MSKGRCAFMVNSPSSSAAQTVRCRPIEEADIAAVVDLLTTGFDTPEPVDWASVLARLRGRQAPAGVPRFGYMLDHGGKPVGVLLLIFSQTRGPAPALRCSVSSWYVAPAFRSFGSLLASNALKNKAVTYLNSSPAVHTRPLLLAQGYTVYNRGTFVALPLVGGRKAGGGTLVADPPAGVAVDPADAELVAEHAGWGCVTAWGIADGRARPFVFRTQTIKQYIRCAQLVYCDDVADVARFAGPLGRMLARYRLFLLLIDADGPVPGLTGRFLAGVRQKYYKGPNPPRFGDLSLTEMAMFGF